MAPITRTCNLALAAALIVAGPAGAAVRGPDPNDAQRVYVAARAAEAIGDEARSAQLFAGLAARNPADPTITQRALAGAIAAGNMPLALKLARQIRAADLPIDGRLLLVAEDLRTRKIASGIQRLEAGGGTPDLGFMAPLIRAWDEAGRGNVKALETLSQIPVAGPLGAFVAEHRALVLAGFRRTVEAEPYARRAIAGAGGRGERVRLEMAEAFRAGGDPVRAAAMLDAPGHALTIARARLAAGQRIGRPVDTPAAAFAQVLLGLAIGLNQEDQQAFPIALAQIARHVAPDNGEAAIVLGLLLDQAGRTQNALAALADVRRDNLLFGQAVDARARTLLRAKRGAEALSLARAAVQSREASAADYSRLGDVLEELERHGEAADAYLRAIALLPASGAGAGDKWVAHLLAGSALEEAGRWPEAKAVVEEGLKLAPDQPLLLNFLGYAKLVHGEDIEAAEAMIRKASALRPSDSSITDSLGWALYKRGKIDEAIATLQKAAVGDPAQSEIGEHLGDALYTAGRRYEARFAWQAALVTAEEQKARRIKTKIERGLEPATAAP